METSKGASARAALKHLTRLEVGDGASYDRMVVFPVFSPAQSPAPLDYFTLAEALREGWAEVAEKPAASVPELVLVNRGKSMLFVLDGEEVVGGRQNRIVNASFLVAPGSRVVLPVSCVEHGRWHGTSSRFESGEAMSFALKREKEQQVRRNLRTVGAHQADQGAIWDHIAERQA
jgi:hypothetical protein